MNGSQTMEESCRQEERVKRQKKKQVREEKLQIPFKHIDPKYINNHSNSK